MRWWSKRHLVHVEYEESTTSAVQYDYFVREVKTDDVLRPATRARLYADSSSSSDDESSGNDEESTDDDDDDDICPQCHVIVGSGFIAHLRILTRHETQLYSLRVGFALDAFARRLDEDACAYHEYAHRTGAFPAWRLCEIVDDLRATKQADVDALEALASHL